MQSYPNDSPETMAQLLTALMAADDRIDDAEVEALSMLDAYARIGIAPPAFADVLRDYFAGMEGTAATERVEGIAMRVTDSRARVLLWEMMVGLAAADDEVDPSEIAFLQRIAALWWNGKPPQRLAMPGEHPPPALRSTILHSLEHAGERQRAAAIS